MKTIHVYFPLLKGDIEGKENFFDVTVRNKPLHLVKGRAIQIPSRIATTIINKYQKEEKEKGLLFEPPVYSKKELAQREAQRVMAEYLIMMVTQYGFTNEEVNCLNEWLLSRVAKKTHPKYIRNKVWKIILSRKKKRKLC